MLDAGQNFSDLLAVLLALKYNGNSAFNDSEKFQPISKISFAELMQFFFAITLNSEKLTMGIKGNNF